jgi:hypothetical protein
MKLSRWWKYFFYYRESAASAEEIASITEEQTATWRSNASSQSLAKMQKPPETSSCI